MESDYKNSNDEGTTSIPLFYTPAQQGHVLQQIVVGLFGDADEVVQAQNLARKLYARSLRDIENIPSDTFLLSAPYAELYLYATKKSLLEKVASVTQGKLHAGVDTTLGVLTAPVAISLSAYEYAKKQYEAYVVAQEGGGSFALQAPEFIRQPLETLAGISDSQRLELAEIFEIEDDHAFHVALERLHTNQAFARTLPFLAPGMSVGVKNVISKAQGFYDDLSGGGAVLAGVGGIKASTGELVTNISSISAAAGTVAGLGSAAMTGSADGNGQQPEPLKVEQLEKLKNEALKLIAQDIKPAYELAIQKGEEGLADKLALEWELLDRLQMECESFINRSGAPDDWRRPIQFYDYLQQQASNSTVMTGNVLASQEPTLIVQLRAYYDYQIMLKKIYNRELTYGVDYNFRASDPDWTLLKIGDQLDVILDDIAVRYDKLASIDVSSRAESSSLVGAVEYLNSDAAKIVHHRLLQVAASQPEFEQAGSTSYVMDL